MRIGLSLSPVIGDANDAIAVATGYDIIWGEKISREERALYAAGLLFGSGSMYRKGAGLGFDAAQAGVMEYRAAQKITRGKNHAIEANHVLGQRFYRQWGRASEIRRAPSEILTFGDHVEMTNLVRRALPYRRVYTRQEAWVGYQEAFQDYPDLLEVVRREIFK